MINRRKWLDAFPIPEAETAIKIILEGWNDLASKNSNKFCHSENEPKLTQMLRIYVKDFKALDVGLLGQWGAEQPEGYLDLASLNITKSHRTDINYSWHNQKERFEVIFEFKKLAHTETSRKKYCGENGLGRFVEGSYAKRHPLSFMVGILMSPSETCLPKLKRSIGSPGYSNLLRLVENNLGKLITEPSDLFEGVAYFDTEHNRPKEMAPAHGTILVSHTFVEFPFSNPKVKTSRKSLIDNI